MKCILIMIIYHLITIHCILIISALFLRAPFLQFTETDNPSSSTLHRYVVQAIPWRYSNCLEDRSLQYILSTPVYRMLRLCPWGWRWWYNHCWYSRGWNSLQSDRTLEYWGKTGRCRTSHYVVSPCTEYICYKILRLFHEHKPIS